LDRGLGKPVTKIDNIARLKKHQDSQKENEAEVIEGKFVETDNG